MAEKTRAGRSRVIAAVARGVIGVVALAIGVAVFSGLVATKPQAPRKPRSDAAVPVEVVTVRLTESARPWEAFGTARAMQAAEVRAEVAGVVVRRPAAIEPGVRVAKGETLLELDRTDAEAALARSRGLVEAIGAQLDGLAVEEESLRRQVALASQASELAERDIERAREAARAGAAVEREIDVLLTALTRTLREEAQLSRALSEVPSRRAALEAQRDAERANLRLAEENLRRSTIVAPFDGVLQRVDLREGDRVGIGELAARVVSLSRIETPLRAPLGASAEVRVGDPVVLIAEGSVRREWRATVERIAPEADAQSRTVTVFVVVEQDDATGSTGNLLPGQFVRGELRSSSAQRVAMVPRVSLSGDRVMVLGEGGRVEFRDVVVAFFVSGERPEIDPGEREWAAVSSGLREGDRVVVSNLDDLRAGALVNAVDAATGESFLAKGAPGENGGAK